MAARQEMEWTALLHISGDRAQADRAAAEIAHLKAGAFQQVEVGQQSVFFLGGELHHQRLQEKLTGDIAVVGGQFLEELALMGGVLVNDADLVAPLREDIGAEDLAHIPQRLRAVLNVKAQLLRGCALLRLIRSLRQRRTLRFFWGRLPRSHVVAGDIRQVDVCLDVQL